MCNFGFLDVCSFGFQMCAVLGFRCVQFWVVDIYLVALDDDDVHIKI